MAGWGWEHDYRKRRRGSRNHVEVKGILPIVATPFTPSGEVDMASFETLCHTLAANGCHGLTLFGIAGEYYKLDDAEREAMAKRMNRRDINGVAL